MSAAAARRSASRPVTKGSSICLLDIDPKGAPDVVCDARELSTLDPANSMRSTVRTTWNTIMPMTCHGCCEGFLHVLKPDGFAEIRVPDIDALLKTCVKDGLDIEDVIYHIGPRPGAGARRALRLRPRDRGVGAGFLRPQDRVHPKVPGPRAAGGRLCDRCRTPRSLSGNPHARISFSPDTRSGRTARPQTCAGIGASRPPERSPIRVVRLWLAMLGSTG